MNNFTTFVLSIMCSQLCLYIVNMLLELLNDVYEKLIIKKILALDNKFSEMFMKVGWLVVPLFKILVYFILVVVLFNLNTSLSAPIDEDIDGELDEP